MFSLFAKKVRVTFINNTNGALIGVSKMKPEQLPESFDKPTTMHLGEKEWAVAKADPVSRKEFAISGNLTLHLNPIERLDPEKVLFTIPTISNELPGTVETRLFGDFTLTLHEDDWRQIEFLPIGLLPTIQEEMALVEAILFPEGESKHSFGYETLHVRRKIGTQHLAIPLDDFCALLDIRERGAVTLSDYAGFVKNGFAARSGSNIYYGIMEGDIIKELCLQRFDSVDDEFSKLVSQFELVLVLWCKGQITTV